MKININLPEKIDSSPKEDVKNMILSWFKETNSKAGHTLDQRNFLHSIQLKLNPKQEEKINEAVNDLVEEGLVEINEIKSIVLTEKGVDAIY